MRQEPDKKPTLLSKATGLASKLSPTSQRRRDSIHMNTTQLKVRSWPKTIEKKEDLTQNKSQTQRARAYKITSFLSIYCELSTETCSRDLYSPGPFLSPIDLPYYLFFLSFHFCKYRAGHSSRRCTPTFVTCSILPVVGLFSPLFFLLCLPSVSLLTIPPS